MQPDPARIAQTVAWIGKSRKDLWRAEIALTLDPPDTEDCMFHCQQAVEKSLKPSLGGGISPFGARTISWNSPGNVWAWNRR